MWVTAKYKGVMATTGKDPPSKHCSLQRLSQPTMEAKDDLTKAVPKVIRPSK